MPIITFDKEHLDDGFMFLARRGEVGCFPNDVFVITDMLFDLLKKSHIPFIQIDNPYKRVKRFLKHAVFAKRGALLADYRSIHHR